MRDQAAKTVTKVTKSIKKDKEEALVQNASFNKDVQMSKKARKPRPSAKKRRFLQLLKTTPKRDENPMDLRDHQIQQVKKLLTLAEKE